MSFLNNLFGHKPDESNDSTTTNVVTTVPTNSDGFLNLTKEAPLNLKKNDFLNLSKSDYLLNKLRAAAGWDVSNGYSDFDLDLCAYLLDSNNKLVDTIYYASKGNIKRGIQLDHDNLTGEGEGDDENIFLNLDVVPQNISRIVLGVVIYSAKSRRQNFSQVKNAYVRLVDESDNDREMFRYNLSNDGGNNTSVIAGELFRNNDGWNFHAKGEYKACGSISELGKNL